MWLASEACNKLSPSTHFWEIRVTREKTEGKWYMPSPDSLVPGSSRNYRRPGCVSRRRDAGSRGTEVGQCRPGHSVAFSLTNGSSFAGRARNVLCYGYARGPGPAISKWESVSELVGAVPSVYVPCCLQNWPIPGFHREEVQRQSQ